MIKTIKRRTEYLNNPIGIDIIKPVLMWQVIDAQRQIGFEIRSHINGETQPIIAAESDSMRCEYPYPLKSRDLICWEIRAKDENGEFGEWSESAFFEMGLHNKSDWQAKWISGNYKHSPSPKVRYPADYFKKNFSFCDDCVKARLYISAQGCFVVYINGKRVGDDILSPGATCSDKRVHYFTYDVTEQIKSGENKLEITLADGFYASSTGCFMNAKTYGFEPKLIMQLEITGKSGETLTICSNSSFSWSNDGQLVFADVMQGEIYDANKVPTFGGFAKECECDALLCASNNVTPKEQEVFEARELIHCPNGQRVLKFPQNIAGYVEMKINAKEGTKTVLYFGEKLDENGCFTTKNICLNGEYDKVRFQRVEYISNGKNESYKPQFAVFGFQYVLIESEDELLPENFKAIAVYSDMESTMEFSCSDETINKIYKNTLWSVKGNFLDVPTDCPTRERAGWTGDARLFFNSGNFMFDQAAFFRKWITDVTDNQKENGMVYNINPSKPNGSAFYEWISMEGSCGWGDAIIAIPYRYYLRYGDDRLIKENWQNIKLCFDFYKKRMGKRNIFSLNYSKAGVGKYLCGVGRDFGEWTEPDDCAPSKLSLLMPNPEEATAYLHQSAKHMAKMAVLVGEPELASEYKEIADNTKAAYRKFFLSPKAKKSKRMCKYIRPLAMELCEGVEKERCLQAAVELNKHRNYKIGTGFLSTESFFEVLTKNGYGDEAYKTLINPDLGWKKEIDQCATTIWENWDDSASLNHYSKGSVCEYFISTLCGIKMTGEENFFSISPHTIKSIDSICARYHSIYGTVESGWARENGNLIYNISIPCNCTGLLTLPDGTKHNLSCGEHSFELKETK